VTGVWDPRQTVENMSTMAHFTAFQGPYEHKTRNDLELLRKKWKRSMSLKHALWRCFKRFGTAKK